MLVKLCLKINFFSLSLRSTFLTIIHVVEPPQTVARDNVPKAFIDFSLIAKLERNVVNEVNYFKILVQEMDIRIDTGFLYALMELFTNEDTKESEIEQVRDRLQTVANFKTFTFQALFNLHVIKLSE